MSLPPDRCSTSLPGRTTPLEDDQALLDSAPVTLEKSPLMAQHTQSPKPGDLLAAAATTPLSSHQNEEVPWLCPCGHTNDATAKRCSGPGNSLTGRCMAWKGGQRNPKPYFTKIKVGRHPITSSSRGLYINTYILCCRRIFCQRYSTRRRTNQKPRLQRLS